MRVARWAFLFSLSSIFVWSQNTINTVAGGGSPLGNGTPLSASVTLPTAVIEDAAGNIYVASSGGAYVFKIDSLQTQISIVAGTGYFAYGLNSGSAPANTVAIGNASGLALDSTGNNLFISSLYAHHVFEVNLTTGILTNFAGNGGVADPIGNFGGDGGPASQAALNSPQDVVVFGGTVYIADSVNNRVRAVGPTGVITTYAGNGTACATPTGPCGDGGAATLANLTTPSGLAVDAAGDLFIADTGDNKIREVSPFGVISTYVGVGARCQALPCGDGGPATSANVSAPQRLFMDTLGNLYIADTADQMIRKVDNTASHIIGTVAGTGAFQFSGDGGAAVSATLESPTGVFADAKGNIFIADQGSNRIREVNNQGLINTVIGGGTGGDGGPALSGFLATDDIALDGSGNQFLVEFDTDRVREVAAGTQTLSTVAGVGYSGFGGDDGPATSAILAGPSGAAIDAVGNLYIADTFNSAVRIVQNGVITAYAGIPRSRCTPPTGACGDNGPAVSANLDTPSSVAFDSAGNLYIADYSGFRVRKVDNTAAHIITTVAGTGNQCASTTSSCGDGGLAIQADLNFPYGLAADSLGDLFMVDGGRIRRVDAVTNVIKTVAFTGQNSFSGDGGAATLATMDGPLKIAVDSRGNLFIGGGFDEVVQRVDAATGTIATVAGNAAQPEVSGFSGNGGPATAATLGNLGLAVNRTGGLYIANNNHISFVQLSPTSTVSVMNLNFGSQPLGVTGSPTPVTLTNTGGDDLLITSIVDANEFSQTNNCPTSPNPLAPSQSCTINVTFTPTATGAATDTLIITDNAAGSPHKIPLTATGAAPFSLSTTCTSLSVVQGQTAIYTVDLAPAKGFTQSVSLACSGAPAGGACTVNPSSATLDGATTIHAKVTATTTPPTSGSLSSPFFRPDGNQLLGMLGIAGSVGLAALVILPGKPRTTRAKKLFAWFFCLCLLSMMATLSSCGVGGGFADPAATPAGSYPLTVTATFKSAGGTTFTQNVGFNLVVQ